MENRIYHLFKGYLYAAAALFFLSMLVWASIPDAFGYIFTIVMGILLSYIAYKNFKTAKESRAEDKPYAPPAYATPLEKIEFYKKVFYAALLAFPLLTLIIVIDLNDLESGNAESVRLWAPVSFLYEQFGYWTAVLSVPLLGVLVFFLYLKKIRSIKAGKE